MHSLPLLIIAAGAFGFGLVSKKLEAGVLTPPMVFTALGLCFGLAAPEVFGLIPGDAEGSGGFLHVLAEITLILVLFTDASRIDLAKVRKDHDLPVSMLAVGMPLVILLGTAVGWAMLPGMGVFPALVLAVILAPTDAALGQPVISHEAVPGRIRQAINVESGLNDGIAVPFFLIALCVAGIQAHDQNVWYWLRFTGLQITLGPLAGAVVGQLGGRALSWTAERGWVEESFQGLSSLALALAAYTLADVIGGNGFIAAFTAGLFLAGKSEKTCKRLHSFGETEGQLLTLLVFLLFGAMLLPPALEQATWRTWAYAAVSLTVVRMAPVAFSLRRSGLSVWTVLFLGWFGPRGVASLVFGMLLLQVAGEEAMGAPYAGEVWSTMLITVFLSVFAHGVTAAPLARLYGYFATRLHASHEEHRKVSHLPHRLHRRS